MEEPQTSFRGFEVPPHFPEPIYDFEGNPPSQKVFELGRKLFFDARLSRGAQVSCGSCHAQVHAFADHGTSVSAGVDGLLGTRNSPPLSNLAWYPSFMWDGGVNHIEVMPLAPITNPEEMDFEIDELISYLQNETEYPELFGEAFGEEVIDTRNMLLAITQFQGLLVSARSKYDQYILGELTLSAEELAGMNLFEEKCSSCHSGVLQSDFSFRNNGIDSVFADEGRMRITNDPLDKGKFKVPSLRNVALTNPYMHDGRFSSLIRVLDHYSDGVISSPTLDPILEGGIPLTEDEKVELIAFLNTLSDFEFISNHNFAPR
jgi:cytochrome c peroxidase